VLAVGGASQGPLLPRRLGPINDYGQTLERAQREVLTSYITELKGLGLSLVYLASWRDPFGSPEVYAREVFRNWDLGGNAILIVLLKGDRGRWHVAGALGVDAASHIPEQEFSRLLERAEGEANRAPPAHAVLKLAEGILALAKGAGHAAADSGSTGVWPYVVGGVFLCALLILLRSRLCPNCFHLLHRRSTSRGIILVCPRCGYTRAPRRGRGTGSRRGLFP